MTDRAHLHDSVERQLMNGGNADSVSSSAMSFVDTH